MLCTLIIKVHICWQLWVGQRFSNGLAFYFCRSKVPCRKWLQFAKLSMACRFKSVGWDMLLGEYTRHHVSEDVHLQQHHQGNLTAHTPWPYNIWTGFLYFLITTGWWFFNPTCTSAQMSLCFLPVALSTFHTQCSAWLCIINCVFHPCWRCPMVHNVLKLLSHFHASCLETVHQHLPTTACHVMLYLWSQPYEHWN
jgi:hypothetical protein